MVFIDDQRRMYAQGSNNRLWDPSYAEGDNFWLVLFMDGNPSWVTKTTNKCVAEINHDHKVVIENINQKIPDIDMNYYISKHFGKTSIVDLDNVEVSDKLIENIKR